MNLTSTIEVICKEKDFVEHFDESQIEAFAKHLTLKKIDENEIIIKECEPASSLMFILEGKARAIQEETQISILEKGDFFGESMFSPEAKRTATVQAMEPCIVAVFTLESYQDFVHQDSATATQYSEYFRAVLHARKERNKGLYYVDNTKYLALIAHNEMKESLMEFAKNHINEIEAFPLVATGTTGQKLYQETGLLLSQKVQSGPLGGDQAVGKLISTNNICGVIFFRDPLSAHPHHADIQALGRLCDVYQVPFATNPKTAEAVLMYLQKNHDHEKTITNRVLEKYRTGQKKILQT